MEKGAEFADKFSRFLSCFHKDFTKTKHLTNPAKEFRIILILQKTVKEKRQGATRPKRVGGRCEPMGEPCRTGLGVACLSLRWGRAGRVLPLQRTLLAGGAAEGGGVIRSRIRVV